MKIRELTWHKDSSFCKHGYVAYSVEDSFYTICPDGQGGDYVVSMSYMDEELTPMGVSPTLEGAKAVANKEHNFFVKRSLKQYKESIEYWEIND